MKKLIHHLRRQPEETRRHILHFLTVIFAVILLSLWVYSLGSNFTSAETQVPAKESANPFTVLKDSVSSLW